MAFTIAELAITSVETIKAYDVITGAYMWTLDELQNTSIAQGEEKTDITGKQGRKITSLKRNKTLTISGTNGMLSSGLLETQTGGAFERKVTKVDWDESLFVASGVATTSFKAIGTAGAEIKAVVVKNSDGTINMSLEQAATAAAGKFAYNPTTKTLSFHTDIADGTEILVYYDRNMLVDAMTDYSDKYSGKAHLFIDAMAEDKCGNVFRTQIEIPKADCSGNVTWEMGDNQTVHNFEFEALAGGCGNASKGGALFTWTVFGVNTEDSNPDKVLSSIAITTAPTTTSYTAGNSFAPTGMVVTATYSDSSTATLNAGAYTYAPNGALTVDDTAVTVSYTEGGVTKTAIQAITVTAG